MIQLVGKVLSKKDEKEVSYSSYGCEIKEKGEFL